MNEEEKKEFKRIKKQSQEAWLDDIKFLVNSTEKLQKENEELKQDRNNNYRMIALAQNEVLGYMQGYEDGKKLKRSAVARVVENQQYYIIKKEIDHYKEYIEKLQKENQELKNKIIEQYYTTNEDCIPKSKKIKDIIDRINYDVKKTKEILTEKEKEYITNIIKPFSNKIKEIRKDCCEDKYEYLIISYIDESEICSLLFPYFEKGKYYKNMELSKKYTLEELGLIDYKKEK